MLFYSPHIYFKICFAAVLLSTTSTPFGKRSGNAIAYQYLTATVTVMSVTVAAIVTVMTVEVEVTVMTVEVTVIMIVTNSCQQ